jgi:hypothetical protein
MLPKHLTRMFRTTPSTATTTCSRLYAVPSGPSRIRTDDLLDFKQALFPLSYRTMFDSRHQNSLSWRPIDLPRNFTGTA